MFFICDGIIELQNFYITSLNIFLYCFQIEPKCNLQYREDSKNVQFLPLKIFIVVIDLVSQLFRSSKPPPGPRGQALEAKGVMSLHGPPQEGGVGGTPPPRVSTRGRGGGSQIPYRGGYHLATGPISARQREESLPQNCARSVSVVAGLEDGMSGSPLFR